MNPPIIVDLLSLPMTIIACCDRELPKVVKTLTAYQLPGPIHLRIVSPHISEFDIESEAFSARLLKLKSYKNATISLLVDRKWISDYVLENGQKPELVEGLEEIGVNIMTVRDLHAKIMLLNAGKEKALLMGSSNFTRTAMHISHEAGVYLLNDTSGVIERIDEYVTGLYRYAQPMME
jgi:hypothetical protein